MGFKCTVKMDAPKTILAKRNLNPGGEAVKTLQKEIHAKAEPYTPKDTGNLIQTVLFNPFIGVLIYSASNRGFIYASRVLNPANNFNFQQNGSGKRGNNWIVRMWIDQKADILKSVAKVAGGKMNEQSHY